MKTLMTGAMMCAFAAAAQAAIPPDSWIALSSSPDARSTSFEGEQSFDAGSITTGISHDDSRWSEPADRDGEFWKSVGRGDRGGLELDDLRNCRILSVAPEPSTWQLLALGSVLLGFFRTRAARRN